MNFEELKMYKDRRIEEYGVNNKIFFKTFSTHKVLAQELSLDLKFFIPDEKYEYANEDNSIVLEYLFLDDGICTCLIKAHKRLIEIWCDKKRTLYSLIFGYVTSNEPNSYFERYRKYRNQIDTNSSFNDIVPFGQLKTDRNFLKEIVNLLNYILESLITEYDSDFFEYKKAKNDVTNCIKIGEIEVGLLIEVKKLLEKAEKYAPDYLMKQFKQCIGEINALFDGKYIE